MNIFKRMLRPVWNLSDDSGEGGGKPIGKIILAVVLILAAIAIVTYYFRQGSRETEAVMGPFIALGQVTAEETAKLLGNQGRVIVITRDVGENPSPNLEGQMEGFKKKIAQVSGVTVAATERIQQAEDSSGNLGVDGGYYVDLVKAHSDIDAIVSLIGPPLLNAQQFRALPQKLPKCLVVSLSGGSTLRRLFGANVVQVAIVGRAGAAAPSSSPPKSVREQFDRYFQIVTAENATIVPTTN